MRIHVFTFYRPPGTGKTSTICALVSRFMTERPRPIRIPGKDKEPLPPKAKILVCAPSNAAIDEIAQRLVARAGGKLNIVRLGAEGSISDTVKPISLDTLVRKKVEAATGQHVEQDLQKQIKELGGEIDALKRSREEKLQELTNLQGNFARKSALEQEALELRTKRQNLVGKFNELRDKVKSENRSMDTLRRQMRREVIQEADVICSTLSGSGHEALIDEEFEMVIIEEAAKAVELSSIIPLKYNCVRCVMVGDPQQLPPTVISQEVRLFLEPAFFVFLTLIRHVVANMTNLFSFACSTSAPMQSICSGTMFWNLIQPFLTVF